MFQKEYLNIELKAIFRWQAGTNNYSVANYQYHHNNQYFSILNKIEVTFHFA